MRVLIILLITQLYFYNLTAQNCDCPAINNISGLSKPSKLFKFLNGKTLGLCGNAEIKSKEKIYSECVIYQCKADTPLFVISALQSCTIEQQKDTLIIEEYYYLPIGKNFTNNPTKFYVAKLYFEASNWVTKNYFKKNVRKYSNSEIQNVLLRYDNTKKVYNSDKVLVIADQLFWAYVSGSKKAEDNLKNLYKKFGPFDGAVSEGHSEIMRMYELYKQTDNTKK
jgi:hypothetical protein